MPTWCVLTLLCVSCKQSPSVRYVTEALAGEAGFAYRIDYGYTDDRRIVFAVIQKVRRKPVMDYRVEVTGERATGWFVIPGKGRINLVDLRGGYEADDTGVRQHPINFSLQELRAFLHQSTAPRELSFDEI